MFQSSSGLLAGCNLRRTEEPQLIPLGVSILIRPEGRMQHPAGLRVGVGLPSVSILIRPEGRMQLFPRCPYHQGQSRFNPHPARRPDATPEVCIISHIPTVSILIRPEGRMQLQLLAQAREVPQVSILIRPEGRMQPHDLLQYIRLPWFQSSSGQKAGCNFRTQFTKSITV